MTTPTYDDEDMAVSYNDGWAAGQRDQRERLTLITDALVSAIEPEDRPRLRTTLRRWRQRELDSGRNYATAGETYRAIMHMDKAQQYGAALALVEESR